MKNYYVMNEVYTDHESIMDRYYSLMKEARSLFPHSSFVTIIVNTNEKDIIEFNNNIEKSVKDKIVFTAGEKSEGRKFISYQFANIGKIKLENDN